MDDSDKAMVRPAGSDWIGVRFEAGECGCEEYLALLLESIQLRFRSDVEVGIQTSVGASTPPRFLPWIHRTNNCASRIKAFTTQQATNDTTNSHGCKEIWSGWSTPLSFISSPEEVPDLAQMYKTIRTNFRRVATLAYARLFELARRSGVVVLLDGQGMDEQWAGTIIMHS